MPKKNTPVILIQRNLLIAMAHEIIGMNDVDIAHVFGTTKQNVNKILGKSKGLVSPEIKKLFVK